MHNDLYSYLVPTQKAQRSNCWKNILQFRLLITVVILYLRNICQIFFLFCSFLFFLFLFCFVLFLFVISWILYLHNLHLDDCLARHELTNSISLKAYQCRWCCVLDVITLHQMSSKATLCWFVMRKVLETTCGYISEIVIDILDIVETRRVCVALLPCACTQRSCVSDYKVMTYMHPVEKESTWKNWNTRYY